MVLVVPNSIVRVRLQNLCNVRLSEVLIWQIVSLCKLCSKRTMVRTMVTTFHTVNADELAVLQSHEPFLHGGMLCVWCFSS
jgi:hypothetical protein